MSATIFKRIDRRLRRLSWAYFMNRRCAEYAATLQNNKEPLLVFQMGKVGSSSIVGSLAANLANHEVFQIHFLSDDWVTRVVDQYRAASEVTGRPSIDNHVLASRYLSRRFKRRHTGERLHIISLVRDPVARNISAFFQAFPVYMAKAKTTDDAEGVRGIKTDELVRLFQEDFGEDRHAVPSTWFQTHLQPAFNIDVFATPFDHDKHYQIIENEHARLLLLRAEDLDTSLIPAVREFMGVELPLVAHKNSADDKQYAGTYRAFKDELRLAESYVYGLYNTPFMRHFYTPEEVTSFKNSWLDKQADRKSANHTIVPLRLLIPDVARAPSFVEEADLSAGIVEYRRRAGRGK